MHDPFTDTLFDEDQVVLPQEGRQFRQTDDLRDLSAAVGAPAAGAGAYFAEQPARPVQQSAAPQATQPAPVPALADFSLFGATTAQTPAAPMLLPLAGAVAMAVAGGWYAGPWGAATGAAASGAVVNLVRYAAGKGESKGHLVFAVVAAALAAYTGNQAYKSRAARLAANPSEVPWLKRT